jgi:hypothetical protein
MGAARTPSVAIDLVDDHGFTAKYASVKRFVVKLPGPPRRRRASSSPQRPVKKAKSITAKDRWCAGP